MTEGGKYHKESTELNRIDKDFVQQEEGRVLKPMVSNGALSLEIDKNFQPKKGTFFRTQEYPEFGEDSGVTGKIWMEAGYNPATKTWVLWQKTIRKTDDALTGDTVNIMSARALFEKTDFVKAYDQMTTFETAQGSLDVAPLTTKTPARLGADYFKQFAWREGLMMSRSGRLYQFSENMVNAANYFNESDIQDALDFMKRLKNQQYVEVPVILPSIDWDKAYKANQQQIETRLNRLYFEHDDKKDSFDLAKQIVAHERPEILYAHIKRGFSPRIFENNPAQHFALVKAAIALPDAESFSLLADAGIGFTVRQNGETPLELVLQNRRYAHLHIMLSRDGAELANYRDESNNAPAAMAIALKDTQAFRMLYQEGLDYGQEDSAGWKLVHHAFKHGFYPGLYAWIDEFLPIDEPIAGTPYTGVSIAKSNDDQAVLDFAKGHGADMTAPVLPAPDALVVEPQWKEATEDGTADVAFSLDLLSSATMTNVQIEKAVRAYVGAGGNLNLSSRSGQSLFSLCWKNQGTAAEFNRRALIPVLGALGADPSAPLEDGSTVLTREAKLPAIDLDFLKAVAPFAKDPNGPDADGNTILHVLQLNPSEAASHSKNIETVFRLFPALDMNRQNGEGYSNAALAVRLDRSQTLRRLPEAVASMIDWTQTVKGGWSILDIAFTKACAAATLEASRKDESIRIVSPKTRGMILEMLEKAAATGKQAEFQAVLTRLRPDQKTLLDAMTEDGVPAETISRLAQCGGLKP